MQNVSLLKIPLIVSFTKWWLICPGEDELIDDRTDAIFASHPRATEYEEFTH